MIWTTLLVLLSPMTAHAGDDHPLSKDRTGMKWQLPFEKARAEAEQKTRLLLIKPVAFGTTPDGDW